MRYCRAGEPAHCEQVGLPLLPQGGKVGQNPFETFTVRGFSMHWGGHYLKQKLPGCVSLQKMSTILGEYQVGETAVDDVQAQKPLERPVILQAFTELTLAAHREKFHGQRNFQQVLRQYPGPAVAGIHPVKNRGICSRALSTMGLMRRTGLLFGTGASGVTAASKVACRTASPRLASEIPLRKGWPTSCYQRLSQLRFVQSPSYYIPSSEELQPDTCPPNKAI